MRKFLPTTIAGITAASLVLGASVMALQAQGAARNVWSGVFTADQAVQGKALFETKCAICHGAELNGGEMAPPLAGARFAANWTGTSLGDLFSPIPTPLPANDSRSLINSPPTPSLPS